MKEQTATKPSTSRVTIERLRCGCCACSAARPVVASVRASAAMTADDPVGQPRHGLRTRILLLRRCAREAVAHGPLLLDASIAKRQCSAAISRNHG